MTKRTAPADTSGTPAEAPAPEDTTGTCCPKIVGTPKWHGAPAKSTSAYATARGWTVNTIHVVPTSFGWDDRTNMPASADRGTKEYWLRGGAPGTSGGKRDLDGSSWVGVGVGKKGSVELVFTGQTSTGCIANATIEVDDPAKAKVSPTNFTAASAKLEIEGLAAGECTVTLKCNGTELGWCHVRVFTPRTAEVNIYRANLTSADGTTDLTSKAAFTAAEIATLKSELDNVYAQCAVTWTVNSGGVLTFKTAAARTAYNATLKKNIAPSGANRTALFTACEAANSAPSAAPKMDLYYVEPLEFDTGVAGYTRSGGVADGIPSYRAMIYAPPMGTWGLTLLTHELGHCVGLYHPNDTSDSAGLAKQLPDNFRLPLVTGANGMQDDHINLMGYGADPAPGASLRYGQWDVVQTRLT